MNYKYIKVFKQIVSIDSSSGQEKLMQQYLICWLKNNNFTFKIDKTGNIFAKNKFQDKPLLFCAHMDTVSPGLRIKPVVKNGFITSTGNTILGADNKAFISALLSVLLENKSKKAIELLFTVKEETGGGIEFFPFENIKSKQGFIFDSANPIGGIVLRSPYITNFYIAFKGKAAHSSTPSKGKNALLPMLELLNKIPIGESDKKNTTINVGLIKGGNGINTIPETVKISGELRSYNKKFFDKYLIKIKKLTEEVSKQYSVSFNYSEDGFCPGYTHLKKDYLISKISKIFKKLELQTKFYKYSGISDANILNSKAIKTVNLTDGVINPHTTDEKISIDSLIKLKQIISAIIYSKW